MAAAGGVVIGALGAKMGLLVDSLSFGLSGLSFLLIPLWALEVALLSGGIMGSFVAGKYSAKLRLSKRRRSC